MACLSLFFVLRGGKGTRPVAVRTAHRCVEAHFALPSGNTESAGVEAWCKDEDAPRLLLHFEAEGGRFSQLFLLGKVDVVELIPRQRAVEQTRARKILLARTTHMNAGVRSGDHTRVFRAMLFLAPPVRVCFWQKKKSCGEHNIDAHFLPLSQSRKPAAMVFVGLVSVW